jgi:parvulin-like peptidyl-prolyl isomerase
MRILLPTLLFLFAACGESEVKSEDATQEAGEPSGSDAGVDESVPPAGDSEKGASSEQDAAATDAPSGSDGAGDLSALHANIAETAARDEHDDKKVEVSHILIAFKGASRSRQARTKDEAEALTAAVLARALAGEDFEALMREHSNDPGAGTYLMSTDGSAGYPRSGMAPAFGDTGWRLAVDQIGVAGYHPQRSGFGWHIIKRVK